MPWSVAAAVAGAATSAALAPSSSGGSGGGSNSYYVPTGLQSADTQWQGLQGQNYENYMGINQAQLPQYGAMSVNQGMMANSEYGPGYQNAANAAGNQYGALASTMDQQSALNFGTQQSLLGAGQQVYQTALDPQSALYNRTAQQLQDQTGATNSMYGLGSSAAGAGVANSAMSNFNIDWQNQQLQRQESGLQAYAGAASTAGSYGQLGTQQASAAPGYQLLSGQVPYQTAQSIAALPGQLGSTYGQYLNQNIYGPAEGIQGAAIPYMNYGQGAQTVPFQSQSQGAGAAGSLVSQGIQGLGSNSQVQSAFGNLFSSGTTGSFGGGDFSGAFSSSPYYSGGGNSYGFTM